MAHARIIRQNFFNDPLVSQKYNLKQRYFLIGLACIADDFGRFWYNEAYIKSSVFPVDASVRIEWVSECLKEFIDDFILCQYQVEKINYCHFPKWFKKGWYLKQKIDHPREIQAPDCPICQTEKKKRETSRRIKSSLNKIKRNKDNNKLTKEKIEQQLTDDRFSSRIKKKYPLITKKKYLEIIGRYLFIVEKHNLFSQNHKREFEGRCMGEHENLESSQNELKHES